MISTRNCHCLMLLPYLFPLLVLLLVFLVPTFRKLCFVLRSKRLARETLRSPVASLWHMARPRHVKRIAVLSLVRVEPPSSLPTPAHGDRIRRSTSTKAYAARGPRTMVSPMETTKGHSCPLDTRPTVRRLETVRSFRAPEPTTCDRFRFHLTSLEA